MIGWQPTTTYTRASPHGDETRYECRQAREFVENASSAILLDNGFADEDLDSEGNGLTRTNGLLRQSLEV